MTSSETLELVIFDVGGVLVELHLERAKSELIDAFGMSPPDFSKLTRNNSFQPPLSITEQAMVGAVSTENYLIEFQRCCTKPVELELIRKNRLSLIGPEDKQMIRTIECLRGRLMTAVLSNSIDLHWQFLAGSYEFFGIIDHIFPSHVIGVAKPRTEAYQTVLDRLKVKPHNALMVDDSPENIYAAEAMGLQTHLFCSANGFRNYLEERELV